MSSARLLFQQWFVYRPLVSHRSGPSDTDHAESPLIGHQIAADYVVE